MTTPPNAPASSPIPEVSGSRHRGPRSARFELLEHLGSGRAGSVWRVRDRLRGAMAGSDLAGRDLALKLLHPDVSAPAPGEIWLGAAVRHPSLVEVLELGVLELGVLEVDHTALDSPREAAATREQGYLLMEYVAGRPLGPELAATLAPADLETVARELLSGLGAIHAAGWTHGDLHPGNVLVRAAPTGPELRILDFGLARPAADGPGPQPIAGTPRYLAPEVLLRRPRDHRADLYAAGGLLLDCLGVVPRAPIAEHLMRTRTGELFEDVRNRTPDTPLGHLVRALLEPRAEDRPATAADALALLAGGGPQATRPVRTVPTFESARTLGAATARAAVVAAIDTASRPRPRPRLVLLEGARGLGKTRLVREARALAWTRGLRCLDWRELAAGATESPDDAAPPQGLDVVTALASPVTVARDRADVLAAGIVTRLVEQPSLVVADDFEALPAGAARLLVAVCERLLGRKRSSAIAIVVTRAAGAPASAAARAWERLAVLPLAAHAELAPWSPGETRAFFDEVLRPARDLGRWEARLCKACDGRPGALRDALEALSRSGELRIEEGAWRLRRPWRRGVPSSPSVAARFAEDWEALAPSAPDALVAASLLAESSDRADVALLTAALDSTGEEVERMLRALRSSASFDGVVRAIDRDRPHVVGLGRALRVRICRAAGREERARWRRRIAALEPPCAETLLQALRIREVDGEIVLAAARRDDAASERLLSLHALSSSAPFEQRWASARLLAERLRRRGENERAAVVLRAVHQSAVTPLERAPVALHLAEAMLAQRRPAEARRFLDEAREARSSSAERSSDRSEERRLFLETICLELERATEAALAIGEDAVRRFPQSAPLHAQLASLLLTLGRHRDAGAQFRRALRLARRAEHTGLVASVVNNLGRLLLRQGRVGLAAGAFEVAATRLERAGMRSLAAASFANLAAALRRRGEFARALEMNERCRTARRELGDDAGLAIVEANLGLLYREVGLPGSARRRFDEARRIAARAGPAAKAELERQALLRAGLGNLELDLGRVEAARELERGLAAERSSDVDSAPEVFLLHARLLALGEPAALAPVERRFQRGRFLDHDAPALFQVAALESGPSLAAPELCAPVVTRARVALAELALAAKRGAFYRDLAAVTASPGAVAGAHRRLAEAAERFPERDARRRALAALLSTPLAAQPTAKGRRSSNGEPCDGSADPARRLRHALRLVLDETAFDLEPTERRHWAARPDITRSMSMIGDTTKDGPEGLRSARVLAEVFRLNRELLDEDDVDKLLRRIVDSAVELCRAQRGVLALRRQGALEIVVARSAGIDLDDADSQLSWTILEGVIASGAPTITTNAREDVELRSIASVEDLDLRSVVCLPLVLRSEIRGALYLDNSFEESVFERRDLELLEHFCAQALLAWRSAERRRELGGLLEELRATNRRLDGELREAQRDERRRSREKEKRYHGMVGDSRSMRAVFELIAAVAPTGIPVLITGESGTGKELVARAIHAESDRSDRPFVVENCAAVPEGLLESALFGHLKGAFTGADRDRRGLFEIAHGGTLFLDEIAEMPAALQTRLLRAIQQGEVRPVGSSALRKVDVRVIAATNRDVQSALAQGTLREDLYYRLQGAEIRLPSLRERDADIPLLVEHFVRAASGAAKSAPSVTPRAMARLVRYPWPGNIRELENEVRRMVLLSRGGDIDLEALAPHVRAGGRGRSVRTERAVRPLAEIERDAITAAMEALGGHRGKVAEALGVSRSTLYLKLRGMGWSDA